MFNYVVLRRISTFITVDSVSWEQGHLTTTMLILIDSTRMKDLSSPAYRIQDTRIGNIYLLTPHLVVTTGERLITFRRSTLPDWTVQPRLLAGLHFSPARHLLQGILAPSRRLLDWLYAALWISV